MTKTKKTALCLGCVCVGGKSFRQNLTYTSTHHVERWGQHSRRYIKLTDDLIPSKKAFLSFINRCSNFMFLLRDWSPASDPHDRHDCSVLHCEDDMQNRMHRTQIRLILSSTMICLLIISHQRADNPLFPPLTLCCSSVQRD